MATSLIHLTAVEVAGLVASGEASAAEVAAAHLDRINAVDDQLHAFLHVDNEGAIAAAESVDQRRLAGEPLGPLAGVPLALKDVFTTKGVPTTCGSRILEGWRPPYDATVTRRLRDAGVVVVGKTNMDEFAMGSSTENSAYGTSKNPWDVTRIPGGSSGGSSAAVAGYEAPLAIGTDTGGSIRQPAAVTGIVGVKPTYGGVSRYGLVAFSSSLDQAGPLARTVLDAALLHEVIAGHDPMDATSIDAPTPPVVAAARGGHGDVERLAHRRRRNSCKEMGTSQECVRDSTRPLRCLRSWAPRFRWSPVQLSTTRFPPTTSSRRASVPATWPGSTACATDCASVTTGRTASNKSWV